MDFGEKICQREDCGEKFTAKSWNGTYCSTECRTIETNKKVLARYHEKKRILKEGLPRTCSKCPTILSKYNKESVCEACKIKRTDKRLKKWGWTEEMIEKSRESWTEG